MRLTFIDLFSGAGGTAVGFMRAGFQILAAVEKDPNAAGTYERNLSVTVHQTDIRELEASDLRTKLKLKTGQLDVLAGCPPCQGFTRMRNGSGAGDSRNDLVLKYLQFVHEFRPKYAVFENVPGIIRTKHGKWYYSRLINGLHKQGYVPQELLLNACNFGVPQNRLRVVVIARRKGFSPVEVMETHASPTSLEVSAGLMKPWVTVREAIMKYPPLQPGSKDRAFKNHEAPRTGMSAKSDRIADFISRVPNDGGSRSDVPEKFWLPCHRRINGYKDVYGRLRWDGLAGTLTTGCTNPSKGRFLHPSQNRGLSYREAAALQSFDDGFEFFGGYVSHQIGNAVPPDMSEAIALAIRLSLEKKQTRKSKEGKGQHRNSEIDEDMGRSR